MALSSLRGIASQYWFWLLSISILCFVLERIWPWRREQRAFRAGFLQDVFWLIFNGHFAALGLVLASGWLLHRLGFVLDSLHIPRPESFHLLAAAPAGLQFVVFLLLKDLLEWSIHNLLHRVPWLWEFHKLHHSIEELDFLGNFRFHWIESVVYKSLTYLPLVVLGVNGTIILWIAVVDTLVGFLNHSNLNLDWGPFRYLVNSPRMHVWHHAMIPLGDHGKNFGVVFSLWDFLFGTAFLPAEKIQPDRLGFAGMERFPDGLLPRLLYPVTK